MLVNPTITVGTQLTKTFTNVSTALSTAAIAPAKQVALNQQDLVERTREKDPERPVPSKSQWRKLVHSIEKPLGRRS